MHFAPASVHDVFSASSPTAKLKCSDQGFLRAGRSRVSTNEFELWRAKVATLPHPHLAP